MVAVLSKVLRLFVSLEVPIQYRLIIRYSIYFILSGKLWKEDKHSFYRKNSPSIRFTIIYDGRNVILMDSCKGAV